MHIISLVLLCTVFKKPLCLKKLLWLEWGWGIKYFFNSMKNTYYSKAKENRIKSFKGILRCYTSQLTFFTQALVSLCLVAENILKSRFSSRVLSKNIDKTNKNPARGWRDPAWHRLLFKLLIRNLQKGVHSTDNAICDGTSIWR